MTYSQKYTIVQFLEPIDDSHVFFMDEWPLHITLADVFEIELSESLFNQLTDFLASEEGLLVEVGDNRTLGEGENTTEVTLIKNTPKLQSLHEGLVRILEENGAVFNSPQFTLEGFLPHSTHQSHAKLERGQQVSIKELSLVDMFVDGDWQKRKVIKSFRLKS